MMVEYGRSLVEAAVVREAWNPKAALVAEGAQNVPNEVTFCGSHPNPVAQRFARRNIVIFLAPPWPPSRRSTFVAESWAEGRSAIPIRSSLVPS